MTSYFQELWEPKLTVGLQARWALEDWPKGNLNLYETWEEDSRKLMSNGQPERTNRRIVLQYSQDQHQQFEYYVDSEKKIYCANCHAHVADWAGKWTEKMKVCPACKSPYCTVCGVHFKGCWKGWWMTEVKDELEKTVSQTKPRRKGRLPDVPERTG